MLIYIVRAIISPIVTGLTFLTVFTAVFVVFIVVLTKLPGDVLYWTSVVIAGAVALFVYLRLWSEEKEPTNQATEETDLAEPVLNFLADLPGKVGYALISIIFWAVVVVGPLALGARTVEVYNVTVDSEKQWVINAPDQERAEIAIMVIEFSNTWTKMVWENLETFLAMALALLLWALVAHRQWNSIHFVGSFLVTILNPWLSVGIWFARLPIWKAGYYNV